MSHIDVTIGGQTAPTVTVPDGGAASVSIPAATGVSALNGLSGAVTLAAVGGSWAVAGTTLTLTVTGGGGGASSWGDLTGKPFTTVGSGLSVVGGALTADVLTTDSRFSDAREWSAATVTQAAAEAGTDTARVAWTVLRVWQAVTAWWAASSAKTKLDGIAAGATANQTDAYLLARANHTGTQSYATITGLGTLATQSGTFSGTSSGVNTGDQTITLTGDVTGSGTGSFAATLSASGVTAGTYTSVTVDSKGRVTAGSSPAGYTLPIATASTLGGIKIGSGLTIDGSGVVTAAGTYTLPAATTAALGGVIVGTGLAVSSGTVSVSYGSTSSTACVGNDSRLSDARTPTNHASTHQTGGADPLLPVVVTPTSLAANANDYAIGTADIFRVSGTAARDITGIAAGSSGQTILLVNVGSFALTLKHQSASSASANRITVPWAGDCVLAASGGAATLVYDSTSSTWRVV